MNSAVYENQSKNNNTTIFLNPTSARGSEYLSKIPSPHLIWAMDSNDDKPRNRLVRMLSYIVCLSKLSREWLSGLVRCSIPAIFLRSNCWVRLPHSFPSRTVFPGLQEITGCPPTSSLCRLPRRSEFPLTPRQRRSSFVKGGWGVTYANKTREA